MRPLHLNEFEGQLYDARKSQWHKRPLRKIYSQSQRVITNTQQLKAALRYGEWAWPGGYPMFMYTSDGGSLHFDCVRENLREVLSAINDNCNDGWQVVGVGIHYEAGHLYCDHCGDPIASAYANEDD